MTEFKYLLKGKNGEVFWQPGRNRILNTANAKNGILRLRKPWFEGEPVPEDEEADCDSLDSPTVVNGLANGTPNGAVVSKSNGALNGASNGVSNGVANAIARGVNGETAVVEVELAVAEVEVKVKEVEEAAGNSAKEVGVKGYIFFSFFCLRVVMN